jgi:predicted GNAT family N-acyltransferase
LNEASCIIPGRRPDRMGTLYSGKNIRVETLFIPPQPAPLIAARLQTYRDFRARIFWDGGRRPAFRASGGSFTDEQELDYSSWHFAAYLESTEELVGYVRLNIPAADVTNYQVHGYLGAEKFAAFLKSEGLSENEVFEWARLAVDPASRGSGLGAYLNAIAIAAARSLGAAAMIGTSGTADGQDLFHQRFGFHVVPGTRAYVDFYTEDVCILINHTADGANMYEDLVDRLSGELAPRLDPLDLSAQENHLRVIPDSVPAQAAR